MDNILDNLRDDEIDTLVQFKANGLKLGSKDKTDHLSDDALDYMASLKSAPATTPAQETIPQVNFNDMGNEHPAPILTAPTQANKITNYTEEAIDGIWKDTQNILTTPYKKFKEWWDDDDTINHDSKIDNDFRHNVSAFSNPKDGTLIGMAGDLLGNEYLTEKGKRIYTPQDVEIYKQNVLKVAGDKYDVEFDEQNGLPSARLKGTSDKFEPVLNDIGDASSNEISIRVSANLAQVVTETGLDIGAGVAFDKKYGKYIKHPALRFIADGTASIVSSIPSAGAGSIAQTIYSKENISTDRLIEKTKEEMADNFFATTTMLGTIGAITMTYKGVKAIKPHHTVKQGKDLYLDKEIYENQQVSTFTGVQKRELREEQLDIQAKQKVETEDIYKDFGGIEEQGEILELVGQSNTKDILGDHYLHDNKLKIRSIENTAQLTKNVKTKFNLDNSSSGDLYRIFRAGAKRAKEFHSKYYDEAKGFISAEVGESVVKVSSNTKTTIDELLDIAQNPKNIEGQFIDQPVKNKFTKEYKNLLNVSNSYFADTNGFTINKLFEFQKTFNEFVSKHGDKFTYEQEQNLAKIKDAIYKDVDTGIKKNITDVKVQKEMTKLWSSANKQYGKFQDLLDRNDIFKNLLDPKYKFDVAEFTQTVFKDINNVDHNDMNILVSFAKEIRATQGTDKLDEFYSSIIDGLFKGKTINGFEGEKSTGLFKTVAHKNRDYEVLDFDAFHKMFNSIDEKQLKKIFNQSKRGRELYFHLKNFDKLAQKEATANLNLFTKEFNMSDTAMNQHDFGKLFYSFIYGAKAMLWDSWSKYVMKSKAYETFMIRALSKPRYEDISSAIKKLDYDQKINNVPTMQRVDIDRLKQSLEDLKSVTKQAEDFIIKNPEASKEQIEEVVISGLIEHKKTFSGRDFDVEKVQAKELAKQNGMPEDIIGRINNFDELGRELKSFSDANKEVFNAHKINPPAKNSDDVLVHPESIKQEVETTQAVSIQKDAAALEIEKEDFKQFLVDAGEKTPVQKEDGIIEVPASDMMSQAMNKQKFMSELELRVYNEPPLAQISQDDKMLYKQYEKMFTTFQGGKSELSKIIPQYTQKAFTQEQRANVTVINDYFGGGGTWGAFFGRLTHQFPNVKTLNIHEFSELRAMKINYLHHKPQALIDTLENDKYIKDLLEGMRQISIDKGDKGSHGFVSPYINKMLEQYKKGEVVQKLTDDQIATLYLVADYAARSVKTIDSTLELLVKQVKGVAQQIAQLKARGVEIKVFNHSSYDDIAQYEQGSHVLSMIDPPYYKTSGYDIFNGDKLIKSEVVDVDLYEKTATLIKNIKEAGNLGIYTDEAWEVKSVKLSKNFKTVTDGGLTDYEVLKDISDNIEYFFRVPEKIGKSGKDDGRTEVLGLINAKGKIDDRYKSSRPNSTSTNNDRTEVVNGSDRGSADTPTRAMERPDTTISEDSTKASQGNSTSPAGRQEPTRRPQEVVEPRVDFEAKAKELNENPPSFDELKALENLEGGLSFSQNVFIPLRGKKINSVGAEAYLKALSDHSENLPREIQKIKYPVNEVNIAKLERLRGYFKTNKEIHGDTHGFGTVANGNQFKALIYDLKKHGKVQRATPTQNKEYEDIYFELQETYDELAPAIDDMYQESIEESIIPFAKFGDNLLAGTLGGVETDEDGNIIGFDEENFIKGFASYTVAKGSAKYLIKHFKVEDKFRTAIQNFIDKAEDDMGKLAGGGKPPVIKKEFKDEDGFYSVLEKVVDEKVGGKIDTVSLTKMLTKNGVKQDELEWSGLKELIENNDKLTKGQIEDVIAENRLVVEVVEKENSTDNMTKYHEYKIDGGTEYRELLFKQSKADGNYKSDHWDESNILVFTRVDDRTIDNKKSLFIEELQSDWHQAGRKDGYKIENQYEDEAKNIFKKYDIEWKGKNGRQFNKIYDHLMADEDTLLSNYWDEAVNVDKSVPNAPFRKNWAELGIKRLVAEAVEKDYDKIAWTTGTQQAQRYSLEKQVDTIVYNKNSGFITGTNNGEEVIFKQVASDEEVEALMGKELTKRLIDPKSSTKDEIYVLQGDELKFGGDGMKAFYDEIVPNAVKKLFKKYKVKPRMEELDEIEEMVWTIDITDKMKADIKEYGQPLYMVGGTIVGLEAISENGDTK